MKLFIWKDVVSSDPSLNPQSLRNLYTRSSTPPPLDHGRWVKVMGPWQDVTLLGHGGSRLVSGCCRRGIDGRTGCGTRVPNGNFPVWVTPTERPRPSSDPR